MSNRWNYQVVEVKTGWMGGFKAEALQEELNKHGKLGWELVNIIHTMPSVPSPILVFKREG
ncbi:DUF4177 domain-containing protein [Pseudoxanthomonas mexicana]|uniref:DUF4177 domain-containing protein n=1 Tax=Pseudoxanthomonas mexicana TaxID=128785 RepID=UPI00398BAAC5